MRTFVIGDVHGWADRLDRLLDRLCPVAAEGDALVFLGDYVDRGPQSRQVVDRVLAQQRAWRGPVTALMGNHEAMMLEALATWRTLSSPTRQWLETADGTATIASYSSEISMRAFEESMPRRHREFFEELALWHEDENGIYVHGGIPPGRHPRDCRAEQLLWLREPFIRSTYAWPKPVVFGHTPQYDTSRGEPRRLEDFRWQPLDRPEKIGLDTGCAYGGPLTAVLLPEREFYDSN